MARICACRKGGGRSLDALSAAADAAPASKRSLQDRLSDRLPANRSNGPL